MIITITLNPAIDKTISISNFKVDHVNKIESQRIDPAGKGINVSKVIKALNGESIALGIIGGETGNEIKRYLNDAGIKSDFVNVDKKTRSNLKIVDYVNHTFTDINEPGAFVNEIKQKEIVNKILEYANKDNLLVLSGSTPEGFDKTIYKEIVEKAQAKGAKVILDASENLFLEGIKSAPYLIKPNVHELEVALNVSIENHSDIVRAARKIIELGVKLVVVSDGGNGSIFVTKEEAFIAKGIKVEVKSTVGAGDSMVAAIAYGLDQKLELKDIMVLASAVSTANVMTEGTQTGDLSIIESLKEKVRIEKID